MARESTRNNRADTRTQSTGNASQKTKEHRKNKDAIPGQARSASTNCPRSTPHLGPRRPLNQRGSSATSAAMDSQKHLMEGDPEVRLTATGRIKKATKGLRIHECEICGKVGLPFCVQDHALLNQFRSHPNEEAKGVLAFVQVSIWRSYLAS